jgi:hypothetical protein
MLNYALMNTLICTLFAPKRIKNGLKMRCFALFFTLSPVHISTCTAVVFAIAACAFNVTHGGAKAES